MMNSELDYRIEHYLQMVESEELRTCKEQKAMCKFVREVFKNEDVYTDSEQLGKYLGLSKYFGFKRLFEWQDFVFALHLCTYRRVDGMPRFPDLFCLMGRGGGKDGTIALQGSMLISPYNRCKQYDVDICAMSEEQATRPLKDATEAFGAPANVAKLKKHFYWTAEMLRGLKNGGVMRGRTNNFKTKDGMRSGVVIFNEFHQYEDYKNITVFTTGLGKKEHPRRSYYTTNGNVREGPLDDMIARSEEILFGGEPDGGLLPFICKLDEKDQVHDPDNWEMAVPGLRYLPSLRAEYEKEYTEWKTSPSKAPDFMAKRCNLPESGSDIAVTDYENIKATNRPLPDLSGWQCTVGIDYATLRDFASVNFHFKSGDMRFDINHTWACAKSQDIVDGRIKAPLTEWERQGHMTIVNDVEIPATLIAEYVARMGERYCIAGMAMDSYRYALLRKTLADVGYDAENRGNIKLLRPSDIMKVQPVVDSCFTNQWFTWGDNPLLRWATNNTKLVRSGKKEGTDTGNFYYAKIEAKSRKTDSFMAVVASMAIEENILWSDGSGLPSLNIIIG